MAHRVDVAPPGREKQVLALKEKSGIDNPFAVAWASYEGDSMDEDLLDDGLDLHQHKGHAVGEVHKMPGAAGGEDELLDDGIGENLPHEVNAPSDPPAHGPEAHGVDDPEPLHA